MMDECVFYKRSIRDSCLKRKRALKKPTDRFTDKHQSEFITGEKNPQIFEQFEI